MASPAAGNELIESLAISLRSRTAPRSFPNRPPWDTFWKEDEDVLGKRLQKMTSRVTAPPERTIYNFHCQPYGSGLVEAPDSPRTCAPKMRGAR